MAKIRIDFLVAETFERLFGTTAFMEPVDKAIGAMGSVLQLRMAIG
jgi:hypothetical protein